MSPAQNQDEHGTRSLLLPLDILTLDAGTRTESRLEHLGHHLIRVESLESAIEALAAASAPDVLVIGPDHAAGNALELLASLDALSLRRPVVLLHRSPHSSSSLVEAGHPFLTLVDPQRADRWIERSLESAIERAVRAPQGPMFSCRDYVRVAVQLQLTCDLALYIAGQDTGHVDVVGGDIWNAHFGSEHGAGALRELASMSPDHVEVRQTAYVPGDRTIHASGLDALELPIGNEHAPPAGHKAVRGSRQAVDPPARSAHRDSTARETSLAPDPPPARKDPSHAQFDELFRRGLAASFARDYERALEAFEQARTLRPFEKRLRHNIEVVRAKLATR